MLVVEYMLECLFDFSLYLTNKSTYEKWYFSLNVLPLNDD